MIVTSAKDGDTAYCFNNRNNATSELTFSKIDLNLIPNLREYVKNTLNSLKKYDFICRQFEILGDY